MSFSYYERDIFLFHSNKKVRPNRNALKPDKKPEYTLFTFYP